MTELLKQNRAKAMVSSALILLPAAFGLLAWRRLPASFPFYGGFSGAAGSAAGKAFAVLGLPLLLLAGHWLCLLITCRDKAQARQSPRALGILFWVMPMLSLFTNGLVYAAAFGKELGFELCMPVLLGVIFVYMGNYLPKLRQNRTLGVKLPWTLRNEENWDRTHRLAGKVWVAGGLVLVFSVLLPLPAMVWCSILTITGLAGIPAAYSYRIYKIHRAQGVAYLSPPKTRGQKVLAGAVGIFTAALLAGAAALTFTGQVQVSCGEHSLTIHASYWADLEADYAQIESIAYRDTFEPGRRTNGFGSARLLLGAFHNQEFGSYTLYAYTGAQGFVVIDCGQRTLVVGLQTAPEARQLCDALCAKTGL